MHERYALRTIVITIVLLLAGPFAYAANISGYKINDTNGNGIWDAGEAGIQNWNITLRNATTGAVIASTLTDSAGFYQFQNLAQGSYNVSEEDKDGWNPANASFKIVNLSNDTMACDISTEQGGASFTGTDLTLEVTGGDESFGQPFTTGAAKTCLSRLTLRWKYGDGSPIMVEVVPNLLQRDAWGFMKELPAYRPQSGSALGAWEIARHPGSSGTVLENTITTNLSLSPSTKYWILMSPKIGDSGAGINFWGVLGSASSTYFSYMFHWKGQMSPPKWTAISNQQMYFIAYFAEKSAASTIITNLNFTNKQILPPEPKFNISGYKINDTSGNGIWDTGEAGIQNWNITLRNATTGAVIASILTNAAGFYQFQNLAQGSYNVSEEDKGGWNHTNASFKIVTLNSDITDLNFTNKQIPQPVGIYGVVFNDANGNRIRDAGEIGLAGWNVRLMGFDTIKRKFTNLLTATGADGKYSLTGMGAGSYFLMLGTKPGWKTTTPTFQQVKLSSGGGVEIDFGMRK